MKTFRVLALLCMAIGYFFYDSIHAEDEFVSVEKRGVVHKFAKMNAFWVDDFTAKLFKNWEEDTFDTFEMVADKKGIAIDIGAWIGTTSIWLSKNFDHVIAVEPDKVSLVFLEKNLKASECTNVTICNKAITANSEDVFFGPRASISNSLNFSTSYVKNKRNSINDFKTSSITFDQLVKDYIADNEALKDKKVTFIKCDIEGGEEGILKDVLNYAYENNCRVWMSFHHTWWTNKKVTDYTAELDKFYAICPKGDACGYIHKHPFGSILLIPKRM